MLSHSRLLGLSLVGVAALLLLGYVLRWRFCLLVERSTTTTATPQNLTQI